MNRDNLELVFVFVKTNDFCLPVVAHNLLVYIHTYISKYIYFLCLGNIDWIMNLYFI